MLYYTPESAQCLSSNFVPEIEISKNPEKSYNSAKRKIKIVHIHHNETKIRQNSSKNVKNLSNLARRYLFSDLGGGYNRTTILTLNAKACLRRQRKECDPPQAYSFICYFFVISIKNFSFS